FTRSYGRGRGRLRPYGRRSWRCSIIRSMQAATTARRSFGRRSSLSGTPDLCDMLQIDEIIVCTAETKRLGLLHGKTCHSTANSLAMLRPCRSDAGAETYESLCADE